MLLDLIFGDYISLFTGYSRGVIRIIMLQFVLIQSKDN